MRIWKSYSTTIDLLKFTLTADEFRTYKNIVSKILNGYYGKSMINIEGLELVPATNYEKRVSGSQKRDYSVLNKVNTNIKLMRKFVSQFNLNSASELFTFISQNKSQIFLDTGKYFELVYTTIRSTEEAGEENEEIVVNYIRESFLNIFSEKIQIKREATSSYRDLILGIDITFQFRSKEFTVQVKPYNKIERTNDDYIFHTSSLVKKYNTDFIAFVNKFENKVFLFKTTNLRTSDKDFVVSGPDHIKRTNMLESFEELTK